jgi:hypothetical protein
MKLRELKNMIREAVRKVKENKPATAPTKPGTIKKPGTGKPVFVPKPGANPRPKQRTGEMNENEQEIVKNIVGRFRNIKKK